MRFVKVDNLRELILQCTQWRLKNLYAFVARAGVKNKWYEKGTSLEGNYGNTESGRT
jgi:hypothetical protein